MNSREKGDSRQRRRTLLGRLIGSRSTMAFLTAFASAWGLTLLAADGTPTTYESSAVVAFQPRDPLVAGAETMVLVTPKYVELLRNPDVLDSAANQLGVSADRVQRTTVGQIQPNTLNLEIIVQSRDAEEVAAQANVLAARVVAAAARDPLLSGQVVAWAVPADRPNPPSAGLVLSMGFALSLLFAILAAVIFRGRQG